MTAIAARLGQDWPLVHNLVEGGVSPVSSAMELAALGYAVALHPLLLLHGFIRQGPRHLAVLRQTGSTRSLGDAIADLHEFNALLEQQSHKS
jgi:2-methylisocitrate lyase-like PEP mutase family enzyme